MRKKYVNIPLPIELAQEIEKIIKITRLGYKTKSEFIKEAVREKINKSHHKLDEEDFTKKLSRMRKDISSFVNDFRIEVDKKRKQYEKIRTSKI